VQVSAKVIRHSVDSEGHEIATLQVTGHRFVLPEWNTHREFSRNVASNRAIPSKKLIEQVVVSPAMPVFWGKNQPGMQAAEELSAEEQVQAINLWLEARDNAVWSAQQMVHLGVHKQIANRLLEPFSWFTAIVTSTQWANFLGLRAHKDAQPEIRALAEHVLIALNGSKPTLLGLFQWHLPYVSDEEIGALGWDVAIKCSVARCARVSYLNHDGSKTSVEKDLALHDQLVVQSPSHASPSEHQATPTSDRSLWGNFRFWGQYRKTIPTEYIRTFERLVGWGLPRAA
jgi:hypothetical protein